MTEAQISGTKGYILTLEDAIPFTGWEAKTGKKTLSNAMLYSKAGYIYIPKEDYVIAGILGENIINNQELKEKFRVEKACTIVLFTKNNTDAYFIVDGMVKEHNGFLMMTSKKEFKQFTVRQ